MEDNCLGVSSFLFTKTGCDFAQSESCSILDVALLSYI